MIHKWQDSSIFAQNTRSPSEIQTRTFSFSHLFNHSGLCLIQDIGTTLEDPVSGRAWANRCFGVLTYETPPNIPFLCGLLFLSFSLPFLSQILRKGKTNMRERGHDFYYEFCDYV